MQSWIIKHFPKSVDADVVEKHFGSAFSDSTTGQIHGLALDGKEKQLLELAQELEEEEQGKKRK